MMAVEMVESFENGVLPPVLTDMPPGRLKERGHVPCIRCTIKHAMCKYKFLFLKNRFASLKVETRSLVLLP
jgi:hypothetical protein